MVIDSLTESIADSCGRSLEKLNMAKSQWIRYIQTAARIVKVEIIDGPRTWKKLEQEVLSKATDSSPKVKRSSSLKTTFTSDDMAEFERVFNSLDKKNFWTLEATKKEAIKNGVPAETVEEKLKKLAVNSGYCHPCHSFILDMDDKNWDDYFTEEELQEIENYGDPLLCPVEKTIGEQIRHIKELRTPLEAYDFARRLDHDPEQEPLLAWLSLSLSQTAYQFLKKNKTPISSYLEADRQYYIWGFLNSIYHCNENISALGKERSSAASAKASNSKRKLSSVDEITRKAMGRKMDTVYVGGEIELGAMEIGGLQDDTKGFKDGMVKLPRVMKDMLVAIANKAPSCLRQTHITGFSINGDEVTLIDADSPNGYITRIRRTHPISFPTSADNFIVRITPLLELATVAMLKMEGTLHHFNNTEIPLQGSRARHLVLPPTFSPPTSAVQSTSSLSTSIPSSSTSTPSSSSTQSSHNPTANTIVGLKAKRQKVDKK
ncbi:hypothetical protein BJV82DRAFT_605789 [Fennellomyces sp. T-0311]|nr:hypothetical protein BJV82DRAFT_605789 [Fennellomyces sp. T-0311]